MRNKGFAFYENFWAAIENLPLDQQKDVCYAIAKYGITGEVDESPFGAAMTQAFKPAIDNSVERFNSGIENGKLGGRPSKITSAELVTFLNENPKVTAKETAEHFGVSESAIQKREEWKNRKNMEQPVEKPQIYF